MKSTQPKYHLATVTCACGHSFTVGSTVNDLRVDICSKCHPFFTGEQKFIDTLGRVDKFLAKRQAASGNVRSKKAKAQKQAQKVLSLKEMLTVTKIDK